MNLERTATTSETLGPDSAMSAVLEAFPGAQRALFRRYHIGGCSSCAFKPEETIAEVCSRNGGVGGTQGLGHNPARPRQDAHGLIEPRDLAVVLAQKFFRSLWGVRA